MAVIIGMGPHKRSATIEIVDERAQVLAVGRFGADKVGYVEMLQAGRMFPDRVWAVEGCNGIGKHIAHRLVHDGETVVDVPPRLSAQVRTFATGLGRARTQTINRLHRLLLELLPGGAKQFLSAQQARALIATIKPRDLVGKTRRRLAVELIGERSSGPHQFAWAGPSRPRRDGHPHLPSGAP